jgi:hypothetical protein
MVGKVFLLIVYCSPVYIGYIYTGAWFYNQYDVTRALSVLISYFLSNKPLNFEVFN